MTEGWAMGVRAMQTALLRQFVAVRVSNTGVTPKMTPNTSRAACVARKVVCVVVVTTAMERLVDLPTAVTNIVVVVERARARVGVVVE